MYLLLQTQILKKNRSTKPSTTHHNNLNNSLRRSESDGTPDDLNVDGNLSNGSVSHDADKEIDLVDNSVSNLDSYSTCCDSIIDPTLPNGDVTYDVPKQIDLVTENTLSYSVR